jgi:uncharacterized protein with GYD domain
MPKYLFKGSYSREGIEAVMREGGSARHAAVKRLVESVGGTLESFDFGFGGTDIYVMSHLPNHTAALAVAATVGASGAMSHLETVVLAAIEEVDAISQVRPDYRPPGG